MRESKEGHHELIFHENLIDLEEGPKSKKQKKKYKSPPPQPKKNQVAPDPVLRVNKTEGVSLLDLDNDSSIGGPPVLAAEGSEEKSPDYSHNNTGWDLFD